MDKQEKKPSDPIMHDLTQKSSSNLTKVATLIIIVAIFGVGTGYMFAKNGNPVGNTTSGIKINPSAVKKGASFGTQDKTLLKDEAEGILVEGGIEGEGEYHLERDGGPSRYVYLTSSLVDLSQFIKRKIKVWGQTQKAQKAGWLMDVGRIEVID